jgi:hypothetical protein
MYVWYIFKRLMTTGPPNVEIESNDWPEGTLLQSMEVTLRAEVESDLRGLPVNHRGAITMLRFIIKHLIICN